MTDSIPMAHHILVIDDEPDICQTITRYLSREGYRVISLGDGHTMHEVIASERIDLVVLDVRLPGKDGFTLARELRQSSKIPIIMLTSRDDVIDRVAGLEAGADDYVPKPFHPRELLARIRSVLRRVSTSDVEGQQQTTTDAFKGWTFNGWILNNATHQLFSPGGDEVPLSPAEYDLLSVFLQQPNQVLSRDQLLDQTRGRTALPYDRSVDVHISHLRRKLERTPQKPQLIKTVRNVGYIFTAVVN